MPAQLDAFDRKILEILQRDNTTPQRTIGEAVKETSTRCPFLRMRTVS